MGTTNETPENGNGKLFKEWREYIGHHTNKE